MHSFDDKFKDMDPKQTVENIKQYFKSIGCSAETEIIKKNKYKNTYWCGIILKMNNNVIYMANGKGLTKDYCLASGYAELYERFCNNSLFTFTNPLSFNLLMEENYKKYNYYICPEEKLVTPEEFLQADKGVRHFCKSVFTNKDMAFRYYTEFFNNKLLLIPYKCLTSDEIKYYNPISIRQQNATSGLAAGNSLNEALVQGISEIFERCVLSNLYKYKYDAIWEVDCACLNEKLQSTIGDLVKTGNEFHIYDLSSIFKLPVVLTVYVDKNLHVIVPSMGSNPIFDIAVERCITEMFQGEVFFAPTDTCKTNISDIILPQQAFKNSDNEFLKYEIHHALHIQRYFPEYILETSQMHLNYCTENYYNNNNASNEELLNFYIELAKSMGFPIAYRDNSKCDSMYALDIYCEGIDTGNNIIRQCLLSEEEKSLNLDAFINIHKLCTALSHGECSKAHIQQFIAPIFSSQIQCNNLLIQLCCGDPFYPLGNLLGKHHTNYIQLALQELDGEYVLDMDGGFAEDNKLFNTLFEYLRCQAYTSNEIILIMNRLGFSVDIQTIEMALDHKYRIYKMLLEPCMRIYTSDVLHQIIKLYSN